jgi:hypothetical protein
LGEAEIIPYLAGVIGALIAAVAFLAWTTMQRTEARHDMRDLREEGRDRDVTRAKDRLIDRQSDQAEVMAGVVARLSQVEDGQSKLADALNRLTRLEEFRLHAMPKLEEAEETARTVIAFGEQMKTVFKRIDVMSEQMNKQSEKIDAIPDAVASRLRAMVRPQSGSGRAANGG